MNTVISAAHTLLLKEWLNKKIKKANEPKGYIRLSLLIKLLIVSNTVGQSTGS